ncbi:MAG: hypothetical protein J5756_01870 [Clostridia bacterium]|nr:hypothetical protein [Clostridia bacterium]
MKKLIAIILILALAVPLLTACAKTSENASSVIESSTGNKSEPDKSATERGERINNDKYFYFIYSTDDGSKWIRDYIGNVECTEGFFYRLNKENGNVDLVLDMRILVDNDKYQYVGVDDHYYAITVEGELIKFPNAVRVQGDETQVLYRRENVIIYSLEIMDGAIYFIEGDEIKMLINEDGTEITDSLDRGISETVFTCPDVKRIYFAPNNTDYMVCQTNERYRVYDLSAKEYVFTSAEFSEPGFNPLAELDEFLGNI